MTSDELKVYHAELTRYWGAVIENTSCCDGDRSLVKEVTDQCSDCGEPLVDGDPAYGCSYSPVECDTCGWRPCSQFC
jgi:hypothetical protein